jgi:hypothetical protein
MHITVKISVKPFPGLRVKTFSALLVLSLFAIKSVFAQMADDFSDGDLSMNPAWSGNTGDFMVNNLSQLQLNAGVAGTSVLFTAFPHVEMQDIEWRLFIKQSFAPSAANHGRFYLIADQSGLSSPLNGYYLQFGEAGSGDAVELFRQSGTTSISVCRGRPAAIATAFEIRIKVIRSREGHWQLYSDYSGGENFVLEASGIDNTYTSGEYTGLSCTYTVTNAMRFFFDEIQIREVTLPDTRPPHVLSVQVTSEQSLRLLFSERIEPSTAGDPVHYVISGSLLHPEQALLLDDHATVDLLFAELFQNGKEQILTIKDVKDLAGNYMEAIEFQFMYFLPKRAAFRDMIISEIFADPSPQVGLPEAEFVELYNRSENPIDLSGWSFSDQTSVARFSSLIVLPDEYLIIASPLSAEKLLAFGKVLSTSSFPSLNNAGDILILKDADGRTVDSVSYEMSWYNNSEKAEGGWSLELIDPQNICAEKSNWDSSEAELGATPGKTNSVFARKPDNRGPTLLEVYPINPDSLLVVFDEKLEDRIPSVRSFITEPILAVGSVHFSDATLTSVTVLLSESMRLSQNYSLTLEGIYDCAGNLIQKDFSKGIFVLPEEAAPGDVLVNEVLFNPRPTGVDFVEIFNRSKKTIQLRNWNFRNFESTGNQNTAPLTDANLLIHPNEYKVFTSDANVLKGEYVLGAEGTFFQAKTPALNDDEGSVALVNHHGIVIDSMHYNDKMHAPFIRDAEGVSLERISTMEGADKISNWRSASSTSGFATPGYPNSNSRQPSPVDEGSVVVDPEIFQLHANTGAFAQIKYKFERGGLIANVRVFDPEGRCIRQIAQNELLGTEGFFRWEGDRDSGAAARVGYYLVLFEIFDDQGYSKSFKKRVAVY